MSEASKNYELAYHVDADVDEVRARQEREKIEALITGHDGLITFSKEPEKIRLSYPIKHKRSSYFGYVQFSLANPEALAAIDEQLRLDTTIVRHIVLKTETEEQKRKAATKAAMARQGQERRAKRAAATKEKGGEVIDKQIEDIIEGL